MFLPIRISWRYITAPKSHGAVSAISVVSVVGVAVATAAIVIVLSVFNGFRHHLNARLDTLTTDVSVTPAYGKTFENGDSLAEVLSGFPGVELAMAEVCDNALVIADTKEMPVKLKGITPAIFSKITSIDSLLLDGTPVRDNRERQVSIAVGVAQRLGLFAAGDTLLLFAPKRHGRVNVANPVTSFLTDSIQVTSVFRTMQSEFDENTVICDVATARQIFQYDTQATAIHLKLKPGADPDAVSEQISGMLGDDYVVKDRMQQQEVNFRMVKIEKWLTFILLTFILVIASFNIISTLCMIILDKGSSIKTLTHIGMPRGKIGRIFWWESLLVTFMGAGSGLILGVCLSLLQEKFSLIKLAGDPQNLVIQAYPVKVEWMDLLITFVPIAIIGLICAWISSGFARNKAKEAQFS